MLSETDVTPRAISGRMSRMDWKSLGRATLRAPSVLIAVNKSILCKPHVTPVVALERATPIATLYEYRVRCKARSGAHTRIRPWPAQGIAHITLLNIHS